MASEQGRRSGSAEGEGGQRRTRDASQRSARPASASGAARRSGSRPASGSKRSGARPSTARQGTARTADGRPAAKRPAAKRPAAKRPAGTRPAGQRSATQRKSVRATQRRRAGGAAGISLPKIDFASLAKLPKPVLAGAGVAVLLVLLLFHHLLRFGITVNGERTTIWRGATIEKVLDKGLVDPKPGNLLSVDGSVIAEGEGERCSATIDGTKAELTAKIHRGADVQIGDGGDTTEEFTEKRETIPHGTSDGDRSFEAYWFGSIHLLSDGQDGTMVKRTGKISGTTVEEVETPAVDAGYSIYTARPEDKVVALTFDDGPWPDTTNQILDILEENGAKATFFTIGNQIAEQPDAVRRAHEMGCQVCTHTWDHAEGSGGGVDLTLMSADEQVNEVQRGFEAIAQVLGEEPAHIMRAPGGNFHDEIINTLWSLVDAEIGWDVDTMDWSRPGSDAIAEVILSVQPGQVVLMHDGGGDRSQTVEALRTALPQLVEQGYRFVTISELIAYGKPDTASDGILTVN